MKQSNIQVVTNEDGDAYGAVSPKGKLTRLGALRAINKELDSWGIKDDVELKVDELEPCNFWETIGGDYDGWQWWSEPDRTKYNFDKCIPLGLGWIYKQ